MKTKNKVLSLALASALLTTSAFSQVTVSGYVETSIFSGDTKGATNPTVSTKSIGNESVIRLAGTGKTYLACAEALRLMIHDEKIKKIVFY